MTVPRLPSLEVWSDLEAAAGALLAALPFLPADAKLVRRDDGTLTLTVEWNLAAPIGPYAAAALLDAPNVLRVVWTREGDGDAFEELEITGIEVHRTVDAGTLTVTAGGPTRVLRTGLVGETTSAGGRRETLSVAGLTAGEIATAYVLPGLPAWVSLGTVSGAASTVRLDTVAWTDRNRQDLLDDLATAVRATGSPCVWRWRRVGRTQYVIDLGDSIAALDGVTDVPELLLGVHLTELTTEAAVAEQMTVGTIRGATVGSAQPGIEHALWPVTAVDLGAQTVTLGDLAGATGPVREDGEFVDLTTPYALQAPTGRLYAITDTAAPGVCTLAEPPVSFTVGDRVELRRDATSGPVSPLPPRAALPAGSATARAPNAPAVVGTVTANSPTTGRARVQLETADPTLGATFPLPLVDAVPVDGAWGEARAWRSALVATVTLQGGDHLTDVLRWEPADDTAMGSVAAGDWLFLPYSVAAATGLLSTTITAIDHGLRTITTTPRAYTSPAPPSPQYQINSSDFFSALVRVRFYRPTSDAYRVDGAATTGAHAGTAILTPVGSASIASLVSGGAVEFDRGDPSGALVTELASPSGVAAYGRVFGVATRKTIDGATNVLPNGYLEDWTAGPTSPPDGWSTAGTTSVDQIDGSGYTSATAGVVVPGYGRYLAAYIVRESGDDGTLTGPRTSWLDAVDDGAGSDRVSVSIRLLIDAPAGDFFAPTGGTVGLGLAVAVDLFEAGGALLGTLAGTPTETCYIAGALTTFSVQNLQLPAGCRARLRLVPVPGEPVVGYPVDWPAGGTAILLDAVQIARGREAPSLRAGSGAARLAQSLHDELTLRVTPPRTASVALRDLARALPSAWGHVAAPLGATARVRTRAEHPAPLDLLVEVTTRDEQLADPEATTLTLSTRTRRLVDLLQQL